MIFIITCNIIANSSIIIIKRISSAFNCMIISHTIIYLFFDKYLISKLNKIVSVCKHVINTEFTSIFTELRQKKTTFIFNKVPTCSEFNSYNKPSLYYSISIFIYCFINLMF